MAGVTLMAAVTRMAAEGALGRGLGGLLQLQGGPSVELKDYMNRTNTRQISVVQYKQHTQRL
jgi:hypothetical protein